MYEFLTGRLVERGPEAAVLDVAGVGYRALVSGATASRLETLGEQQTLFVRHLVREEKALLFGFASREERELFDRLCSVSKVGPATALSLLSALSPEALATAVEAGDVGLLAKVKGIGKRTAERLCVELRGRLAGADGPLPGAVTDRGAAVVAALAALGFARREAAAAAEVAVREEPADAPLEALVKRALAAGRAAPGPQG
jgi:Holliday junction DNA helicase RuvA